MTIMLVILVGALVLGSLVLFPVVGLAMVPVVALGFLVLVGWLVMLGRRGPGGLPEHPAPGEERSTPRPASGGPRGTRADRSA